MYNLPSASDNLIISCLCFMDSNPVQSIADNVDDNVTDNVIDNVNVNDKTVADVLVF